MDREVRAPAGSPFESSSRLALRQVSLEKDPFDALDPRRRDRTLTRNRRSSAGAQIFVYPRAGGRLATTTHDALRTEVRKLAPKLRRLQRKLDSRYSQVRDLGRHNVDGELWTFAWAQRKFRDRFRERCLLLAIEINERVGPVARGFDVPEEMRAGSDAILTGNLTLDASIGGAADFLEALADLLPRSS